MNKNRIRLTESQLHRVIKESVKRVLTEISGGMDAIANDTYRHRVMELFVNPLYEKIEQGIEQGNLPILAKCYQELTDLIVSDMIQYNGIFVALLEELKEKRNMLTNEMVRIVKSNV